MLFGKVRGGKEREREGCRQIWLKFLVLQNEAFPYLGILYVCWVLHTYTRSLLPSSEASRREKYLPISISIASLFFFFQFQVAESEQKWDDSSCLHPRSTQTMQILNFVAQFYSMQCYFPFTVCYINIYLLQTEEIEPLPHCRSCFLTLFNGFREREIQR